jgi:hypothetical protein
MDAGRESGKNSFVPEIKKLDQLKKKGRKKPNRADLSEISASETLEQFDLSRFPSILNPQIRLNRNQQQENNEGLTPSSSSSESISMG